MKVAQHLWFERDMESAVRLYVSLIPGSEIDWISAVPADNPSGAAGAVRTMAFRLGDQSYQALQAGGMPPFNTSFSVVVQCDAQDEIDHLWAALLEGGGKESQCGWLTDRWGLSWQIVPRRLGELMSASTGPRAKRVTEAMLKMVKFDIAALEAAAEG
jgi:predicted 3-demethylubiquinone-9 3-methyltransferase (glyoxalase superfamily)